jgi:hypothetical protein
MGSVLMWPSLAWGVLLLTFTENSNLRKFDQIIEQDQMVTGDF